MNSNSAKMDRLGTCAAVGVGVLFLAAGAILLLFADSSFRSQTSDAESILLVQTLGLDNLSMVPSGRPLRNPGTLHPAVHPGFGPEFLRIEPDPADLILSKPDMTSPGTTLGK